MTIFAESPEDIAFEKLMRRVPRFEPDPPECEVIQAALDREKEKRRGKNDFQGKRPRKAL